MFPFCIYTNKDKIPKGNLWVTLDMLKFNRAVKSNINILGALVMHSQVPKKATENVLPSSCVIPLYCFLFIYLFVICCSSSRFGLSSMFIPAFVCSISWILYEANMPKSVLYSQSQCNATVISLILLFAACRYCVLLFNSPLVKQLSRLNLVVC